MVGFEEIGNTKSNNNQKKGSTTPVLDNFSRDLNELALAGKLDVVVGREKEIERIIHILSRRKKNNPIIVGDAGIGKTSLVEGLALKIVSGDCPEKILDKRIVLLDLASLVAGTKYRGQFEERLKIIMDELIKNPEVIIFIDEIHTLIGTGNSSNSLDASNILKPALARGEIQCIGATTLDEYRESFEKDGALERRFQKMVLDAPDKKETLKILKSAKVHYEDYHNVSYLDDILKLCVDLADKYITSREFPDKALDIMDEAGAKAQMQVELPDTLIQLRTEVEDIKQEKEKVVKNEDYDRAAELRDEERKILDRLMKEKKTFETELKHRKKPITEEMVLDVVSVMTKIPINKLTLNDVDDLIDLDEKLKKIIIGQDNAIDIIVRAIQRNKVGIREHNKPIGSFIFLGNSGVGKTFLARQIAKEVFGSEDSLIRVDMSEYQEKHTVSRIIGSPPGYVGYGKGGELTEKVKNKPYSVILFDEVEKANRDIFSILLRILDEGSITDSLGKKIDFKNTLIIFTSNLGVKKIEEFGAGLGFGNKGALYDESVKQDMIEREMKRFFAPEFLNRIDETIIFNSLSKDNMMAITKLELASLNGRLVDMGYNIRFEASLIDHLSEVGYDIKFGARPLKRAIRDLVETFITDGIMKKVIIPETKYKMGWTKNGVALRKR